MTSLGPGPRDHLITASLRRALSALDQRLIDETPLDAAEAPHRFAGHIAGEMRIALDGEKPVGEKARLVNDALRLVARGDETDEIDLPPSVLLGIRGLSALGDPEPLPPPPATPFSQSDLLVNAEGQPNIGSEIRAELASADSVDLVCAFVIWSGVRHLRDALRAVVERGGRVRVITTTYMGATEKRAVDELVKLGAEVRVAFDARTTKLHAKAWLIERSSGLSTAFVGSSNLSHTALFDGLEWNVRLSSMDAPQVIDRVRMTFESHWASEHFEDYRPEKNGDDLSRALHEHDRRSRGEAALSFAGLDVRPYPHQQRMLDALTLERERHHRHANLVVAATGTGKTVVAALDYKQLLARAGGDLSLLFVAHRQQILDQALGTYRAVLRDGSFGEMHGGGRVAAGRHVFAMVQSLHGTRLEEMAPDAFDVVVVDEFHHAAAPTYDRLLSRLRPAELLGLTATPERLDGRDVTEWFGGRIAVELRLWEAIDQGFLVPFQYFGVSDGTDLTRIRWTTGGYSTGELSNLYTGDDARVAKLLEAIRRIAFDLTTMRALGFCVSKGHARYMARKFTEAGLPSAALTGDHPDEERRTRLAQLQKGDLRCIFSVEVLGEGVDVPDVDTVILLRPTASATVFTQQLGRGLRRADGKSHLTVIDLIGQHRREFSFEDRLRAIVNTRHGTVRQQVESDFPFLPAGCTIELDLQSRAYIIENLRAAVVRSRWGTLVADLRAQREDDGLAGFLATTGHRLEDVYRSGKSWTALRRAAGKEAASAVSDAREEAMLRTLGRLTHIDDPERVSFYRHLLEDPRPPRLEDHGERHRRLLTILAWGLGSARSDAGSVDDYFRGVWDEPALRAELDELLALLDDRSQTLEIDADLGADIPLTLHARYSRQEVIGALGFCDGVSPTITQGGVLWVEQARSDVFFVDLRKSERDYSPTTMYRDYAISPLLFHWESQSRQHPGMATVQRYINHRHKGSRVLLFVRERKKLELGTAPFTFLGSVRYVEHRGERPVAFTWRLPEPMPQELFETARSVAAA